MKIYKLLPVCLLLTACFEETAPLTKMDPTDTGDGSGSSTVPDDTFEIPDQEATPDGVSDNDIATQFLTNTVGIMSDVDALFEPNGEAMQVLNNVEQEVMGIDTLAFEEILEAVGAQLLVQLESNPIEIDLDSSETLESQFDVFFDVTVDNNDYSGQIKMDGASLFINNFVVKQFPDANLSFLGDIKTNSDVNGYTVAVDAFSFESDSYDLGWLSAFNLTLGTQNNEIPNYISLDSGKVQLTTYGAHPIKASGQLAFEAAQTSRSIGRGDTYYDMMLNQFSINGELVIGDDSFKGMLDITSVNADNFVSLAGEMTNELKNKNYLNELTAKSITEIGNSLFINYSYLNGYDEERSNSLKITEYNDSGNYYVEVESFDEYYQQYKYWYSLELEGQDLQTTYSEKTLYIDSYLKPTNLSESRNNLNLLSESSFNLSIKFTDGEWVFETTTNVEIENVYYSYCGDSVDFSNYVYLDFTAPNPEFIPVCNYLKTSVDLESQTGLELNVSDQNVKLIAEQTFDVYEGMNGILSGILPNMQKTKVFASVNGFWIKSSLNSSGDVSLYSLNDEVKIQIIDDGSEHVGDIFVKGSKIGELHSTITSSELNLTATYNDGTIVNFTQN